jgi:hypothetical protein
MPRGRRPTEAQNFYRNFDASIAVISRRCYHFDASAYFSLAYFAYKRNIAAAPRKINASFIFAQPTASVER